MRSILIRTPHGPLADSLITRCLVAMACALAVAGCANPNATATQSADSEIEEPPAIATVMDATEKPGSAPTEADDTQVTLTNETGYDATEIALRPAGSDSYPAELTFADVTFANATDTTLSFKAPRDAEHAPVRIYDVRLTTADHAIIEIRNVDFSNANIVLRFGDGVGYDTHTDVETGDTVSTEEEARATETEIAESGSQTTYDMENQGD